MEIRTHVIRNPTYARDISVLGSLLEKGWEVAAQYEPHPSQTTFVLRRRLSLWAWAVGLFRKKGPKSWALKRNV